MSVTGTVDHALWFDVAGAPVLGILSLPERAEERQRVGVLICVGGPQYRVGSHRQFVLLARRLAAAGYPTLRFDYRGIGDSYGSPRSFTELDEDIAAASKALQDRAVIDGVVLWGLCDAASAALLALNRRSPVRGLVLVNPWLRSEGSQAATQIKHYYGARFRSAEFWRKLIRGQFAWRDSIRSLADTVRIAIRGQLARSVHADAAEHLFQTKMANALRSFSGPVLLVLSGNDLTANEFLEYARSDAAWLGLLDQPRITRVSLTEADHTFSCAKWRAWVEDETIRWLAGEAGTASSG
ncbi:MAG: hydrolase 1, exosortase A system-associated [Pseudomonadota bacterium]|nr:hydrolase 1, exosortase A system-associated [Pseudomonadota bacterium]